MPSIACRLILGALLTTTAGIASTAEVTIYRVSGGGLIGLGYYVDGHQFAILKNGQKVTIRLPPGLHTFRLRPVDSTWTFNVTGKHVIRQAGATFPPYWVEMLVDRDPALLKEFEEMERVEATDPNPLGLPPE